MAPRGSPGALAVLDLHGLLAPRSEWRDFVVPRAGGDEEEKAGGHRRHEAYMLREVPRFAFNLTSQARSPRKVYATDVGLRNAVAFRFSEDLGRLAETVVHAHLARGEGRLFHVQEKRECGFLRWLGDRAVEAVQVCYEEGGSLPSREVEALLGACRQHGLAEGTVITDRLEGDEQHGRVRVRCVPLWKWALRLSGPA